MSEQELMSDVLVAVRVEEKLYLLYINYEEEADIANAIGDVYVIPATQAVGSVPQRLLATNDTLRCMWASPQGSVWVGSADGTVGTTAQVTWPASTRGIDYLTENASAPWTATDLPRLRPKRLEPNITALWGTADDDVYAGTYGGHIYHWDGAVWTQVYEGPGRGERSIRAFAGTREDVYAIGAMQTLLHFDGTRWQALSVPEPVTDAENLTGICAIEGRGMLISTSGRIKRLLEGTAAGGFTEFGRYEIPLMGMARMQGRILFAAKHGAAELIGRDIQMIRTTFDAVSIWPGDDRVYFIPPDQPPTAFIQYVPAEVQRPWTQVSF
jgi:hypothetical protein